MNLRIVFCWLVDRNSLPNQVIECTDPEEEKIGFLCHAHDKTSEEEI